MCRRNKRMLPVKKKVPEEEREIFDLDRKDRKQKKTQKKIRVRIFDMVSECFKGKGFVEIEVSDDEDAFLDNESDFGTINIKEEDI